jgi:hypothetical protein
MVVAVADCVEVVDSSPDRADTVSAREMLVVVVGL